MKRFKRLILNVFNALFACTLSLNLYAQTYTLSDDDVVVTAGVITSCSYSFEIKSIIIPPVLDGQTVTGIADAITPPLALFYNKGIISVSLPNTIVNIGDNAFYGNLITGLNLSGYTSLSSIGHDAFSNNAIASLDLSGCSALISIRESAFASNKITSLDLSGSPGLKTINNSAFSYNLIADLNLTTCTALTLIGDAAFQSNKLTTVDLTKCTSLLKIGGSAFRMNTLTSFALPEITYKGTLFTTWKDGKGNSYTAGTDPAADMLTFYLPYILYTLTDDDVVVTGGVITSCSYNFELKNIIIPQTLDGQTITGIADGATPPLAVFYDKGIASVTLPPTLQRIGSNSFYSNLISGLTLSGFNNLTSIGDYAFYSNGIININLTGCSGLVSIGQRAFSSNKIANLNLSGCPSLKTIDNSAFYNNLIVGLNLTSCANLTLIAEAAFQSNQLTSVDLSGCTSLLKIGSAAFRLNPVLDFGLPEVTYKGTKYTLWKDGKGNSYTAGTDPATDLLTYYLPFITYTLTSDDVVVAGGVITSCSYNFELKNIIIPQTLDGQTIKGISDAITPPLAVFYDKGIVSVRLPETIERIGDNSFYQNNISELDLSVCLLIEIIGAYAFSSNNIYNLDFSDCKTLISIGSQAFASNSSLSGFTLPSTSIPGYFYSYWTDSNGGSHSASEKVTSLSLGYNRVLPEIASLSPVYAPTAGNLEITITGKNFETARNNKRVLFGAKEALTYVSWSDTQIKVVCPSNSEGSVTVKILLEDNTTYKSPRHLYYSNDDIVLACGNISGTWTNEKTYLLNCNVTIPEGETLTVEEGVKIIAMADEKIKLYCYGSLIVNGTSVSPVTFSSSSGNVGTWEGILIYGTGQNCKFNHTIFEYATTAVSLYGEATGCLSYSNQSEFRNCKIRNNSTCGLYGMGTGDSGSGCSIPKTGAVSPLIQNCEIYNNGNFGINLAAYDGYRSNGFVGARIYNCLIYNNGSGIFLSGDDNVEPKIINNVIAKNSDYGIKSTHEIFDAASFKVANNIFSENKTGIFNNAVASITLNNNGFWANTTGLLGAFLEVSDLYQDPLFNDITNNDFTIKPGSPCIDAGSNIFADFSTDFAGNVRIVDGLGSGTAIVDMGAFEYSSYPLSAAEKQIYGSVHVYPIPTNGHVYLEGLDNDRSVEINIVDIRGQIVMQFDQKGPDASVDLSEQPDGIYFIILKQGKLGVFKAVKTSF